MRAPFSETRYEQNAFSFDLLDGFFSSLFFPSRCTTTLNYLLYSRRHYCSSWLNFILFFCSERLINEKNESFKTGREIINGLFCRAGARFQRTIHESRYLFMARISICCAARLLFKLQQRKKRRNPAHEDVKKP